METPRCGPSIRGSCKAFLRACVRAPPPHSSQRWNPKSITATAACTAQTPVTVYYWQFQTSSAHGLYIANAGRFRSNSYDGGSVCIRVCVRERNSQRDNGGSQALKLRCDEGMRELPRRTHTRWSGSSSLLHCLHAHTHIKCRHKHGEKYQALLSPPKINGIVLLTLDFLTAPLLLPLKFPPNDPEDFQALPQPHPHPLTLCQSTTHTHTPHH